MSIPDHVDKAGVVLHDGRYGNFEGLRADVDSDGGLSWSQLYKNRSARKIDSRRLFSKEYDFPKTFFLLRICFPGRPIFIQFVPGPPWRCPGSAAGCPAVSPPRAI